MRNLLFVFFVLLTACTSNNQAGGFKKVSGVIDSFLQGQPQYRQASLQQAQLEQLRLENERLRLENEARRDRP